MNVPGSEEEGDDVDVTDVIGPDNNFREFSSLSSQSNLTRSVSSGDGGGARSHSVFENSALHLRSRSDDANIGWIFDGGNRSSGKDELLPSLAQIDDVL